MQETVVLAISLSAICAVAVVSAILLKRFFGCTCHMCGVRTRRFDQLSPGRQKSILQHFQARENRTPDTKGIFVCPRCSLVYDDFSGEKRSQSGDTQSICKVCGHRPVRYVVFLKHMMEYQRFLQENPERKNSIECFSCKRNPIEMADCLACKADTKVTGCTECGTLYRWVKDDGTGLKFLTALTEKPILKECNDAWGVT